MIDREERIYKPSQVVRKLTEEYGLSLTPSAIRKYDIEILDELTAPREPNAKRLYSEEEVECFFTIATLRSLGYSLKFIKTRLFITLKEGSDGLEFEQIISRMERQKKAFDKYKAILLRNQANS